MHCLYPVHKTTIIYLFLQAKFEDKWNSVVVPKLIEAEVAGRSDETAMRERLNEAVYARAAEALQGEAARLKGYFEQLEARIAEAKSLAAASCQPMSTAAKVGELPIPPLAPPPLYSMPVVMHGNDSKPNRADILP